VSPPHKVWPPVTGLALVNVVMPPPVVSQFGLWFTCAVYGEVAFRHKHGLPGKGSSLVVLPERLPLLNEDLTGTFSDSVSNVLVLSA